MSVSAIRNGYNYVHIGRAGELSGFTLSKNDFEVLGTKILTHNSQLAPIVVPYITRLFTGGTQRFDQIEAFLLLEELELFINSDNKLNERQRDQLMLIYNNLKYQTYSCMCATIEVA